MAKRIEPGERIGSLVVEGVARRQNGLNVYRLRCDCGKTCEILSVNVRRRVSCQTCSRARTTAAQTIHGLDRRGNRDRLFGIWRAILTRCYNPNSPSYRYYGARGVSVCDEWRADFMNFRDWAMSNGYLEAGANSSIDRRKSEKPYDPNNCRWISRSENSKRMRASYHFVKKSISDVPASSLLSFGA